MQIDEDKIIELVRESGLLSKTDLEMAAKKAKETNEILESYIILEKDK